MNDPGDNFANYVWTHLFIYQDLEGTLPAKPERGPATARRQGDPRQHRYGPVGQEPLRRLPGLRREAGGAISSSPILCCREMKNVPLELTASHLWDALGLPLTAFNDSRRKGKHPDHHGPGLPALSVRSGPVAGRGRAGPYGPAGSRRLFRHGARGHLKLLPLPLRAGLGRRSLRGRRAEAVRPGVRLLEKELSGHQRVHGKQLSRPRSTSSKSTTSTTARTSCRDYNPEAASNRLGRVGSVNCPDCHGDNISGNLQTPRPRTTGYTAVRAKPLTEAVHSVHARYIPMPDKAGRTQNCQACHPTHWQNEKHERPDDQSVSDNGRTAGTRDSQTGTSATSGGGCYLRRDAHTNPDATPPFFLNDIGKWYLNEVSMKDENGKPVKKMRGLYCTNCHNHSDPGAIPARRSARCRPAGGEDVAESAYRPGHPGRGCRRRAEIQSAFSPTLRRPGRDTRSIPIMATAGVRSS